MNLEELNMTPGLGFERLLFFISAANFNVSTDQALTPQKWLNFFAGGLNYYPTRVLVRQRSGSFSAAAGGIYDAASKGGNVIVAAATTWSDLSAANSVQAPPLAAFKKVLTTAPVLSLTTANGAALTADVAIYGFDMT